MSKFRLFCIPSDYELLAAKHPRLNELYFVRDAISFLVLLVGSLRFRSVLL